MNLRRLSALGSCAIALLFPIAASAHYYMDKQEAEHLMRDHLHKIYTSRTAVYCRPQGLSEPDARYVYHRWACSWLIGYSVYTHHSECYGETLIAGSSDPDTYYTKVVFKHGPYC